MKHAHRRPRWPYILIIAPVLTLAALLLLQGPFAHRTPPFTPAEPPADLEPLLTQAHWTDADYETVFLQTGLGRPAVDKLLSYGEAGKAQLLSLQEAFYTPVNVVCDPLCGLFTREDHMTDDQGETAWAPPLVDLQKGDILLTFSTHSFGWRHGHAGLVVDDQGDCITLEAALIGTDSSQIEAWHWRSYSNYVHLRLRNITPELQDQLVEYALDHLDGVPYHLTSGLVGPKAPDPEALWFGVQCDYLVWYVFQHFGYDLDGDGGRLVTTADLAAAPQLEVVQLYGLDPHSFLPS